MPDAATGNDGWRPGPQWAQRPALCARIPLTHSSYSPPACRDEVECRCPDGLVHPLRLLFAPTGGSAGGGTVAVAPHSLWPTLQGGVRVAIRGRGKRGPNRC
jgi:hypothetical protein